MFGAAFGGNATVHAAADIERHAFGQTGFTHARQGLNLFHQPRLKLLALFLGVALEVEVEGGQQQFLRLKSEIHVGQLLQAAEREPGADQDHAGDGDLTDHQQTAQRMPRAGHRASAFVQSRQKIEPCGFQRRQQSGDQAGDQ